MKAGAEDDYNLAAERHKPRVGEEVSGEDPGTLIRQVLTIEREMTAGLERLLNAFHATVSRISGAELPGGDVPQILSESSRESTALISATPSRKSLASEKRPWPRGESGATILQTGSAESTLAQLAARFPLPWSAYVRLLAVKNEHARGFYETEALRDGWSVRQLDRQIKSQFHERTALSKTTLAEVPA